MHEGTPSVSSGKGRSSTIKIGGRGVWRVDRNKVDVYLEQLEKETAEWAKAHPLEPEGQVRARQLE